jgi:hypothetical protein
MSQSQLQKSHTNTNGQDNIVMDQLQVLGTIPRSTHGSTKEGAKEPIKLGKFLCTDRTVCLAVVNCPPGRGGLTGRQARTVRSTKVLSNRENISLCKWSTKRSASPLWTVRQPLTVRETHTDGPWMNRAEKCELARTPPQSRHWISQTTEALEARFGGVDMRH